MGIVGATLVVARRLWHANKGSHKGCPYKKNLPSPLRLPITAEESCNVHSHTGSSG